MATLTPKLARTIRRINGLPMPLKVAAGIVAASLAALLAPPPAFAEAPRPPVSVAVAHGDLDLGSLAGRRALKARVEGAARQLCDPERYSSLREWTERRACFGAAVASADGQIARALAGRASGPVIAVAAGR